MKRLAVLLFAALPMFGQIVTRPDLQIVPLAPRDGQPLTISWSQSIAGTAHFGTPVVNVSPPFFGVGLNAPRTIVISQTATFEGPDGTSTDRETLYTPPVVEGTYSVTFELTVQMESGPAKSTFTLDPLVVAPACPLQPGASATYSWEKGGYELDLENQFTGNVYLGTPALVSIEGHHVTVRQSLTFGGVATDHRSCTSSKIDLGPLAPGTYDLTWIYDEFFAPASEVAIDAQPTMTIELSFEAEAPRRRTSRR